MIRAWIVAILCVAGPVHAATYLPGPMPMLGNGRPDPSAPRPAPMPDPDMRPPSDGSGPARARLAPGLIDRSPPAAARSVDVPGAGYSSEIERRTRPGSPVGGTLAPSLYLHMPLQ